MHNTWRYDCYPTYYICFGAQGSSSGKKSVCTLKLQSYSRLLQTDVMVRIQSYSVTQCCDIVTGWLAVAEERAETLNITDRKIRLLIQNVGRNVGSAKIKQCCRYCCYWPLHGNLEFKEKQNRQCIYNVMLRRVHTTIVVVEKQRVLHSLCVCLALGIRHAMCMSHIVICGLPLSALFFHIISQTARLSNTKLPNTKCVFWFSLQLYIKHLSLYEELSEMWSEICIGLHVKYRLLLSDFSKTWIFSTDFRKIPDFMKILSMGAELLHTDGRTDRHDEANCRFSQFCEKRQKRDL